MGKGMPLKRILLLTIQFLATPWLHLHPPYFLCALHQKGGKNMKLGGTPTLWFFCKDHLGQKFTGEFTGTAEVKTKSGKQEVVVFVATISGQTAEWQAFGRTFVCDEEFEPNAQQFEGEVFEKFIRVKLL